MALPCSGFTVLGLLVFIAAVLAAPAMPNARERYSAGGSLLFAQSAEPKYEEQPETPGKQKVPGKPAAKPVCYKDVNQNNCDCMMYEKTGSQWRPVDCVPDTYCEAPENPC